MVIINGFKLFVCEGACILCQVLPSRIGNIFCLSRTYYQNFDEHVANPPPSAYIYRCLLTQMSLCRSKIKKQVYIPATKISFYPGKKHCINLSNGNNLGQLIDYIQCKYPQSACRFHQKAKCFLLKIRIMAGKEIRGRKHPSPLQSLCNFL